MQHSTQSLLSIWVNLRHKYCMLRTQSTQKCTYSLGEAHMHASNRPSWHTCTVLQPSMTFHVTFSSELSSFMWFCCIQTKWTPHADTMVGYSGHSIYSTRHMYHRACVYVCTLLHTCSPERLCVCVCGCVSRAFVHMCPCISTELSPLKSVYRAEALLRTLGWQSVTPLTPGM